MSVRVAATGEGRDAAVAAAVEALQRGELVVLPTDTVYGVAADAFSPTATRAVFSAKARSRRYPLGVLVRSTKQVPALVAEVPEEADRLMAAYWPGPLTIVMHAQPGLVWDLGDNEGTVAVRMPLDDVCLEIIREVGPLAVSGASLAGKPLATNVDAAEASLGESVAVYVDDGERAERPSTILDLTRWEPLLVRDGELPPDEVMGTARGGNDGDEDEERP